MESGVTNLDARAVPATLPSRVYEVLRDHILSGELLAGASLRDSVLATSLGVSRAPVRSALDKLVETGLVTKKPNLPYQVVVIDASDVSELQLLRFADEAASVRTLVSRKIPLDDLEIHLLRMREAQETGDMFANIEADLAFHMEIVNLSQLPRLITRYEALVGQLRVWMHSMTMAPWTSDTQEMRHVELADAIRNAQETGDPGAAIRLFEVHLIANSQAVS